ncbi:hypothetical protein SDJN03_27402, partial [Cucurbita argyrosperma subsp. sororia]
MMLSPDSQPLASHLYLLIHSLLPVNSEYSPPLSDLFQCFQVKVLRNSEYSPPLSDLILYHFLPLWEDLENLVFVPPDAS